MKRSFLLVMTVISGLSITGCFGPEPLPTSLPEESVDESKPEISEKPLGATGEQGPTAETLKKLFAVETKWEQIIIHQGKGRWDKDIWGWKVTGEVAKVSWYDKQTIVQFTDNEVIVIIDYIGLPIGKKVAIQGRECNPARKKFNARHDSNFSVTTLE